MGVTMGKEIIKLVAMTFGISAGVTLAVIILALWLTHYVTKRTASLEKDHSQLRDSLTQMEASIEGMRQDLTSLKEKKGIQE